MIKHPLVELGSRNSFNSIALGYSVPHNFGIRPLDTANRIVPLLDDLVAVIHDVGHVGWKRLEQVAPQFSETLDMHRHLLNGCRAILGDCRLICVPSLALLDSQNERTLRTQNKPANDKGSNLASDNGCGIG